jgi:hypothetical protein
MGAQRFPYANGFEIHRMSLMALVCSFGTGLGPPRVEYMGEWRYRC